MTTEKVDTAAEMTKLRFMYRWTDANARGVGAVLLGVAVTNATKDMNITRVVK